MEAIKYNKTGEKIGETTLPQYLFDAEVNKDVLYEVINMYRSNQRQGTKSVKGRAEIRTSGRKLHRQKGTGRARAGDAGSPIRVGGGRVFAIKPKDWYKKIPKKKKRLALRSALSSLKDRIFVVEDFDFEKPSTKEAKNFIKSLGIDYKKILVLMPDNSKNLIESFRNLQNVNTVRAQDIHAYQILNHSHVLITENAVKKMEETFHE
ncbi:MAG: 50S ribosomal protein L4 [Candidatus Cloacimonetes bacterium]|nr:50S ribosomal protein L4 [Candidatus Cloacimonadota bacterium]MBS3766915.1 50S ribosomal protein L4 [Candidatus Cloacimonadota bacterium]